MDEKLLADIVAFCEQVLGLQPADVRRFLQPKTTRQGNAFWSHRREFGLLLLNFDKDRLRKFFDLINFLGTQSPGLEGELEMVRANWLLRFNRVFCCQWHNIKANCRKSDDPKVLVQILTEVVDARVYVEPAFHEYRKKHRDQTIFMLYDTRALWLAQGRPIGGLYLLIATLHRHGVDLLHLSADTCADFQQLIHVHPPGGRFKGFGRWGRGDAEDKSVATNVLNHFKKHVLNAGAKPLDWPAECEHWWAALGIDLELAQMDLVPVGAVRARALECFRGARVLPRDQIVNFLLLMADELKRPGSPLMNWFIANFHIRYRDRTLAMALRLTNVAVFMERGAVYVSGAVDGFYVIGRIDEGVLTISSCYVARDLAAKLVRNVLWSFN